MTIQRQLQQRFWVPIAFAVFFVLFYLVGSSLKSGSVSQTVTIGGESEAAELGPFKAEKGQRFLLTYSSANKLPTGYSGPIEISLFNALSDELVLTLEDWFWAESGIWHEGGESGRWHESNEKQTTSFYIPETGEFKVGLDAEQPISIKVSLRRQPISPVLPLTAALLFGIIALLVYLNRSRAMWHLMGNLDVGTILVFAENPSLKYKISSVTRYFVDNAVSMSIDELIPNSGKHFSISYKLVAADNSVRYMDVETLGWEYSFKDSEGDMDDRMASAVSILVSVPNAALTKSGHGKAATYEWDGTIFRRCPENSGTAWSAVRVGTQKTLVSKGYENFYMPGAASMSFEDKDGRQWGIPSFLGDRMIVEEAEDSTSEEVEAMGYYWVAPEDIEIRHYVPQKPWPKDTRRQAKQPVQPER